MPAASTPPGSSGHRYRFIIPDRFRAPAGQPPPPVDRQPARPLGRLDRTHGAPILTAAITALVRVAGELPTLRPMRVLVHIHTFNDADFIEQALDGLQRQTRAADAIRIVDNASTDGTLDRTFPEHVTVIRNSTNLGSAGAVA